ncbi:MAG: AraC family transcriptional regulator [Bacteroidota bacterium]
MTEITASFSQQQFECTNNIKRLYWSGNHWYDILYFPKDYQVGYISDGNGAFTQGDKILPISAGQFFLVHPGNVHSGKPDNKTGWAAEVLVIKCDYVYEICRELNHGELKFPIFEPMVADKDMSKSLLTRYFHTIDILTDKNQTTLAAETNLFYAIHELLSLPSSQKISLEEANTYQVAVERAKTFIEQNFKENFSLDDLSNHAYLSKFHLLRVFKEQVGLSPNTFQIQLRLNEARKLIFQNKSLTEVALELGFSDQAHFTNTFKKYSNGASPRDLKKTAIFYNFKE